MGGLLAALERLLLPNACIGCERIVGDPDPDGLVCSACRAKLHPVLGGCPRCRQPLPLIGPCRFCTSWPAQLAWVRSAVWLEHEARQMVHHLKYQGYTRLAEPIAECMVRHLPRPEGAALVPIPLSARRLAARGYNQAALIAQALAPRWRIPLVEELLSRHHDHGSQTRLTPAARLANVAKAFAARPPGDGGHGTRSAAVIIVDDVLTTGATLAAAAGALAAAGWSRLSAVTFARALPFERRLV